MNRRVFLALAVAVLPLSLGACASGGAGTSSGRDPDLLTMEDFANYQASDTYTVIQRLRGSWLRTRSTGTMSVGGGINQNLGANDQGQIKIYVDGSLRADGVNALREIPIQDVREIRRLNGRDATTQYGTDHGAGAILVFTKS